MVSYAKKLHCVAPACTPLAMDMQAQALPDSTKPTLMLVDGSGYIFRAYHALPPLTRKSDGTPVGAVYGFTNMLMKLCEQITHDHIAVIFDAGRTTFRNDIYAEYKANRDAPPEDLVPQFALVREATQALNLPAIELPGYEADDLIATYAKQACIQGVEVVIVSSDKDLMQLMREGITLHDPMKNKHMDLEDVKKKFGVTPDKVIEVQALMGDSSDNIPGVPGIGPKTAAELINTYGDVETVLARAGEIKQNKRRESLIEYADQARISYELVQLKDDITLPAPIEELGVKKPDPEVLLNFLQVQSFNSLVKKVEDMTGVKASSVVSGSNIAAVPAPTDTHYSLITTEAELDIWIAKATVRGRIAIDTETTSLDATQAQLVGISLSVEAGEACYIPVGHMDQESGVGSQDSGDLFAIDSAKHKLAPNQLPVDGVLQKLQPLLTHPSILKIGQNIKYDAVVLARYGVHITPVDDTMLLSYVVAAGLHNHGMDELSQRHLGHKTIAYKDVVGSGKAQKNFAEITPEDACNYAAEDADITLRLHGIVKQQVINDRLSRVYESIERPLVDVIVAMESAGIKVDADRLKAFSNQFAQKMATLETEIHILAGRSFNIGSPKQLGEILFDEMGIEGGKKSAKTGAYSTGAEILEDLAAQGHTLPEKVLAWRSISKLKSTYTDALQNQVNPHTGRVHTSYSMATTTTGRLSSSDPNLQNIPIRTEEGRKIREAFIAEEGNKLIGADYSQIELRLLAHIAEIDVLKEAFKEGCDIHATTASQMFGVALEAVDSELRRKAKTINFGIIYGISAHGLATRLGIGRKEAADYIEAYFAQYPGIRKYMERTKELAREQGYVETLYGRRVHVKDINAKNPNLRAFSERAAINAPLQGTAADIIKKAMIGVHSAVQQTYPEARLLLQVHDELVLEAPATIAQDVANKVAAIMQSVVHLSIPLTVDAKIGDNWGEIH